MNIFVWVGSYLGIGVQHEVKIHAGAGFAAGVGNLSAAHLGDALSKQPRRQQGGRHLRGCTGGTAGRVRPRRETRVRLRCALPAVRRVGQTQLIGQLVERRRVQQPCKTCQLWSLVRQRVSERRAGAPWGAVRGDGRGQRRLRCVLQAGTAVRAAEKGGQVVEREACRRRRGDRSVLLADVAPQELLQKHLAQRGLHSPAPRSE
jgi:hypothetical protein